MLLSNMSHFAPTGTYKDIIPFLRVKEQRALAFPGGKFRKADFLCHLRREIGFFRSGFLEKFIPAPTAAYLNFSFFRGEPVARHGNWGSGNTYKIYDLSKWCGAWKTIQQPAAIWIKTKHFLVLFLPSYAITCGKRCTHTGHIPAVKGKCQPIPTEFAPPGKEQDLRSWSPTPAHPYRDVPP